MKIPLRVKGAEQTTAVELRRVSGGDVHEYQLGVDERNIELCIEEDGSNSGWIRSHGKLSRYHVLRRDKSIQVWLDGRVHTIDMVEPGRRGADAHAGPVSETLVAPMPGNVLQIKVKPGDSFEAHQPLVIMESMKMEMSLSIPHAGRVGEIRCEVGKMVDMGTVLLTVAPAESDD